MTEVVSLMDIDEDENQNHSLKPNKGKNVVVASTLPDSKATPWVEKYRPHSLADVAAHRDIVDAIPGPEMERIRTCFRDLLYYFPGLFFFIFPLLFCLVSVRVYF
ncbi:hypothetical protein P3X46_028561 [Hevea brasiliensis]|uniref:Uncharacterized protein n=1 Tax=Hevea brasiliensis TaxID=3981 RepID=A0ABQ9KPH7_HEVBR|nr:hypothetical protein P3X46_028561 [Hevea brasiliensis]